MAVVGPNGAGKTTLIKAILGLVRPAAGRILGFVLMIYAIGIFTYFIGSVASVLVAFDAGQTQKPRDKGGVELDEGEVEALRSILKKAEGS